MSESARVLGKEMYNLNIIFVIIVVIIGSHTVSRGSDHKEK